MSKMKNIIIVGGGAAGFFSAINNKIKHPESNVIIIEKSNDVLTKVKLSGGGRCNVTHACFDPKLLTQYYPRGEKELRGAFYDFQPKDTMKWFEDEGVELKIEDDGRVFPKSNSSQTIVKCLSEKAHKLDVKIWMECSVLDVKKNKASFELLLSNQQVVYCEKLILASGSGRSGYSLAQKLGHTLVDPIPSLFTFKINDKKLNALSGLSVSFVEAYLGSLKKQAQTGPMLITHWGMSGPAIIKLSAYQAKFLYENNYSTTMTIDFLPKYSRESVLEKLVTTAKSNSKKTMCNLNPFNEIPNRFWEYFVEKNGFKEDFSWGQLGSKGQEKIVDQLKIGRFLVSGKGQFKEEFVTCGGVSLKEVNFKTMESKCCSGLHIVGEMLDVDGVTGGFNFQNAWTTGYLSA